MCCCGQFLNSNLSSILAKLRSKLDENVEDVRAFFARRDASGSGVMGYDQFRQLLLEVEFLIALGSIYF